MYVVANVVVVIREREVDNFFSFVSLYNLKTEVTTRTLVEPKYQSHSVWLNEHKSFINNKGILGLSTTGSRFISVSPIRGDMGMRTKTTHSILLLRLIDWKRERH